MATSQALLALPRQVFYDGNGVPLAGGKVHTYIPSTTTNKLTYQDAAAATPNSNPIVLDAGGSCLIYGAGSYQITVTNADGASVPAYSGVTFSFGWTDVTPAGTFNSIAALRANGSTPVFNQVLVGGYYALGDTGGGTFWWNSSDTTTADNGGTIIVDSSGNRWYRETDGSAVNVRWFGAKGDNSADDTNASTAAITWAIAQHGTVYFPAGVYKINTQLFVTLNTAQPFAISGDGQDLTQLIWANGGGIHFSFPSALNSAIVRDMSLLTGGSTSAGTALTFALTASADPSPAYNAPSLVENVTFRGSDGYGVTAGWQNGVHFFYVSNFNVTNCYFIGPAGQLGTGVTIEGNATLIPVVFNFQDCIFNLLNVGLNYSSYTQGVTVNQCNFTGCNYGVYASATGLDQLAITNSQFNCSNTGILIGAGLPNLTISNNTILIPNTGSPVFGIYGTAMGIYAITGNAFQGFGHVASSGITITSSSSSGVITGNMFYNLLGGITLGASSVGVNVQSNSYNTVVTAVSNSGGGGNTIGGGST